MFKAIAALLEAGKIGKEDAEALDAEVSKALKDLRDESAKLRNEKKELAQSLEEVKGSKEQLAKQVENLDERIKKAKEEGKSELVTQLEAERAEKETLKASLEEIERKNRALTAQSALQSALSKFEVIDGDVVGAVLLPNLEVTDSGVKYKDGENVLDVEEGLKKFFEAKPHLLKSKGQPGSGAGAGGEGGTTKKWSEMSATERLELYKKDPALYERLKKEGE